MGYLYLLCVALMFSFGGTFVRLIKPYYNFSQRFAEISDKRTTDTTRIHFPDLDS